MAHIYLANGIRVENAVELPPRFKRRAKKPLPEIAGPVSALAVGTGWVPVSSAEDLAAEMRAEGVRHHKLAVAARRRGAYSKNARHRAASSALLLYAYKLRRLVEDATVRQPAPNDKLSHAAESERGDGNKTL